MRRRTAARGLVIGIGALAAAMAPASAAWAQAGVTRAAAAEALFRDARRLMAAGDLGEACPKFVAAQKLDPTVGTALNIGECFERAGKTASAWAGFDQARAMAKRSSDGARAAEAERRIEQLAPKLSRMLLAAPPGGLPAGIQIRLDAQPIDAAAIGTAIPVDPGAHAVEVTGPNGKWSARVMVAPTPGTTTVELHAPPPHGPVEPSSPAVRRWGAQRIAGVSVGALGVAGVVVGSIFGLRAIARKSASNDGHCDALDQCDPTGKTLRDEGIVAGNVSTASFVAGGVALAGGLALFFTAPSSARRSASAGPRVAFALGIGDVRVVGAW